MYSRRMWTDAEPTPLCRDRRQVIDIREGRKETKKKDRSLRSDPKYAEHPPYMTTIRTPSPSRWLAYLLRSLISRSSTVICAISASGSQHRPTEYTLAQRVVSRRFAERYEGSTRSAGYAYCNRDTHEFAPCVT